MKQWLPIVVSVLLAIVPVVVWSRLLLQKTPLAKKTLLWIFAGGSFSVVPIFILQWLWTKFPVLNIIQRIEQGIENPARTAMLVFVVVGVMEEVVKQAVVRAADRRHPELMQTVNATLVFSIASALGFAFAENIFYFYNIWVNLGLVDLFSSFVFRSIFTAAGHMTFSGIFGYYFGIAKFSSDITAQERYEGKKFRFTKFLAKIFGLKTYEAYRRQMILTGLFTAMGVHAIFNFLLQMNLVLPVIGLVIISGGFVYYLLHRVAGHLLFSLSAARTSSMAPKDEEVVIEMLGMWSNEGKHQEVIDLCNRLLERDPDNNVVKLFRAKAADNQKLRTFYESLKGVFAQKKTGKETGKSELPVVDQRSEGVVLDVLGLWFQEGNYKHVIDVAQKLLSRNSGSEGAKIILKKALDSEKLQKVFDSLKLIFEAPPQK